MNKTTKNFVIAIAERAIKTFAETFVALAGANAVNVFTLSSIDALKAAGSAAVLSVLTSIGSAKFGPHGPSLATESVDAVEVAGH